MTVVVVWLSDDYRNAGYLHLAMNISNFFAAIALYNMRYFQVSDIKNEYTDKEYVASRVFTCVASIVICAVFIMIGDFSPVQRKIIIIYVIFRANESFIDVLHGIDQKNGRMDYVGISMFARGISMITAFTVLMWLFNLTAAILGVVVVTVFIGIVYDLPKTKRLADYAKYAGKHVFLLLKRCFPLMLVLFIITTIGSYSRYSIERIHGTEALGIYASVTVPTLIVQVAAFPMLAPLTNLFAAAIKEGDKKKFLKIFMGSSAVIFGIIIIFTGLSFLIGEWGLGILYRNKDEIIQNAFLLPGAFIVSGFVSYIWLMNIIFAATRDLKGILIGNFIGVIICLATTDFFLNRYYLEGANFVMMLSQGTVAILLILRIIWVLKNDRKLFIGEMY